MSARRGDLAKKRGMNPVARSGRSPFALFATGFQPGTKRTGAGTSCNPPKGKAR